MKVKSQKSKVKKITAIIACIFTGVLINYFMPVEAGVILALGPLVIPAITSGISAISGLLGQSEEEKRNEERKRMITAYVQQMRRNADRAVQAQKNSDAMYSDRLGERRGNLNAKLDEFGLNPVGTSYANEKDLVNANVEAKQNIDSNLMESNDTIQGSIDQLNAGMETPESGFSKFFGGAVKGFNLGSQISGAIFPPNLNDTNTGDNPVNNNNNNTSSSNSMSLNMYNSFAKKKKLNKYGAVSLPEEISIP